MSSLIPRADASPTVAKTTAKVAMSVAARSKRSKWRLRFRDILRIARGCGDSNYLRDRHLSPPPRIDHRELDVRTRRLFDCGRALYMPRRLQPARRPGAHDQTEAQST